MEADCLSSSLYPEPRDGVLDASLCTVVKRASFLSEYVMNFRDIHSDSVVETLLAELRTEVWQAIRLCDETEGFTSAWKALQKFDAYAFCQTPETIQELWLALKPTVEEADEAHKRTGFHLALENCLIAIRQHERLDDERSKKELKEAFHVFKDLLLSGRGYDDLRHCLIWGINRMEFSGSDLQKLHKDLQIYSMGI